MASRNDDEFVGIMEMEWGGEMGLKVFPDHETHIRRGALVLENALHVMVLHTLVNKW